MSEEMSMRDLLLEILSKQKDMEKRMEELEKVAHPQSVMADPELTAAIKRMTDKLLEKEVVDATPRVVPTIPSQSSGWDPNQFRVPSYCSHGVTIC